MPTATIPVDPTLPPLSLQYFLTYSLSPSNQAKGREGLQLYTVPGTRITYAISRPEEATGQRPPPKERTWAGGATPSAGTRSGTRFLATRATPRTLPDRLWITGTKISFAGRILANAGQNLGEWKAGLIQSIYKSERDARYQDGSVRRFRLNTAFGPLKDGEPNTPFYGGGPQEGEDRIWMVNEEDAPNFKVPAQYGPNKSMLTETFGMDCFCTFLVLARERDKSIIELSRVRWQISWEGNFDPLGRYPWSPTVSANFFKVEQSNNPTLYATLNRRPGHVPFSLHLAEAENFFEILENGEWKPCNAGGDTGKPGTRSLSSWRTSVVA